MAIARQSALFVGQQAITDVRALCDGLHVAVQGRALGQAPRKPQWLASIAVSLVRREVANARDGQIGPLDRGSRARLLTDEEPPSAAFDGRLRLGKKS